MNGGRAPHPRRVLLGGLAVLAATGPLHAQETVEERGAIVGRVVEEESGEPLVAALVRVLEVHRSEPTHADGTFSFRDLPAGRYTVAAERIGYHPVRQTVDLSPGQTVTLRLELHVSAIPLGELVVTGTLTQRSGEEVLSPTSVVAGAELERRLGGTVAGTVAAEPGVAVTSLGPATARPVIRGLGGDRILVLEDGMRPGDLSSTSGDHAVAIEPLTAQRVEVVRGPMSLLYGSSALGGVVNVVREEVPQSPVEDLHGTGMVQGSSVNSGLAAGFSATAGVGALAFRGEGSFRTSDDVDTPGGTLANTDATTYSGSAGAAWIGERGHVGGSYRFYANDYGIPGGFIGGHAGGVDIEMRRHAVRGEGELHSRAGPFERLEARGGYSAYEHTEITAAGSVGTRFQQDLVSGDLLARHAALGALAEGAVGVRFQYRDITTGGSLRTPSTYDYTVAGFIVEELGRGDLRLQAGTRWDYARYVPRDTTAFVAVGGERIPVRPRSFGSLSGSLGALYRLAEGVRAGASVSRAYRTPDFNELFSNGPHLAANSFDVGDPRLGEETGVGADVFLRVGREALRLEVAAFRNWLNDFIFPSSRGRAEQGTQGNVPRFQYTNEDARFTGAEGQLEWNPLSDVVVSAGVSWVRAEFTSQRDSIPMFEGADTTFVAASPYPPLIPPLRGSFGLRYERPEWFAGFDTRLSAEQDRLGDFETATDGYALLDLVAGIRFRRWGRAHSVTLRVENATDEAYRDHLSRIKEIMPEPGRNVSLLYRLAF